MGFSYADVLISLILMLMAGVLLLGASREIHGVDMYMKERNVAFTIMYEQLYNAPWYSETATNFDVWVDEQKYTVARIVTRGCSGFGASAQEVPFCSEDFKDTTVTVHWKDHTITKTRVSRLLP